MLRTAFSRAPWNKYFIACDLVVSCQGNLHDFEYQFELAVCNSFSEAQKKDAPPQRVLIYLGEARKVCASLFYIYFRYWNFQLNNKIMHQTPMEHIRNCMGFGKSSVTYRPNSNSAPLRGDFSSALQWSGQHMICQLQSHRVQWKDPQEWYPLLQPSSFITNHCKSQSVIK